MRFKSTFLKRLLKCIKCETATINFCSSSGGRNSLKFISLKSVTFKQHKFDEKTTTKKEERKSRKRGFTTSQNTGGNIFFYEKRNRGIR